MQMIIRSNNMCDGMEKTLTQLANQPPSNEEGKHFSYYSTKHYISAN